MVDRSSADLRGADRARVFVARQIPDEALDLVRASCELDLWDGDLPPPLRATTWLALALIAFSLYDIIGREAYGRFMALSIISVCFLVVVGTLTALRWRRLA